VGAQAQQRQVPRLRARSFLATVLEPVQPVEDWIAELDALSQASPGFFTGRPVILDAGDAVESAEALRELIASLSGIGVRIMGVEGADPAWLPEGLPPPVTGGRSASRVELVSNRPAEPRKPTPSLIIEQPVRSGQSIVFAHGDVTVLGSVASGAEIIAAGSIHVYGTLRGRALAGSVGQGGARIFCRRFAAELLAIDGHYKTAEELDGAFAGKAVQAWLDGGAIQTAVVE
jgi:septum site-determining protein MinC